MNSDPGLNYLQLAFASDVEHRGPFHYCSNQTQADGLLALSVEVQKNVIRLDKHTWCAPSAWEAACWLMEASRSPRSSAEGWNPLTVAPECPTVFFRGQRDAEWPVTTSLQRASDPEHQIRLAQFVVSALQVLYGRHSYVLPVEADLAVMQHYGVPTWLLDVTVHPLVAVFFACHGAAHGQTAAVYWINYADALRQGLTMVFPPFWAQRLYRQHGAFLTSNDSDLDLDHSLNRIVFPADPGYCCSGIGFLDEDLLLEGSMWFDSVLTLGRNRLPSALTSEAINELAVAIQTDCGQLPFILDYGWTDRLEQWLEQIFDLLDWTALTYLPGSATLKCHVVRQIAQWNPYLFRSLKTSGQLAMRNLQSIPARSLFDRLRYLVPILQCMADAEKHMDQV
jgi:hypothetical protein